MGDIDSYFLPFVPCSCGQLCLLFLPFFFPKKKKGLPFLLPVRVALFFPPPPLKPWKTPYFPSPRSLRRFPFQKLAQVFPFLSLFSFYPLFGDLGFLFFFSLPLKAIEKNAEEIRYFFPLFSNSLRRQRDLLFFSFFFLLAPAAGDAIVFRSREER